MVTRRQGIILDGFGAYPADSRRGVFVFVRSGSGLEGFTGGRIRCGFVCRRHGFIAATSDGSVGVGSIAVTTASPSAVTPSGVVCLSFRGGRGRHWVDESESVEVRLDSSAEGRGVPRDLSAHTRSTIKQRTDGRM